MDEKKIVFDNREMTRREIEELAAEAARAAERFEEIWHQQSRSS